MATCDVNTLMAQAACFSCLSSEAREILKLQLLCAITQGGGGGGIGGSGTTNTIPKFTAATTLGNSQLTDDGTTLTAAGNLSLTGGSSVLALGGNGASGSQLQVPAGGNAMFSVLSSSSLVYLGANVYWNGAAWVQSASGGNTNSSLLGLTPGTGAQWWASSNSSASFNVASAVQLWDSTGTWRGLVTPSGPITLASWTTAGRPASPVAGMIGYNTDTSRVEHYNGGWKNWVRLDGDTMTGALTAPNFILSGVANTAFLAATGYSLTGNNAQSALDIAGTWNTTGTPTALKVNVTDTASNAASLLADLQIGGTSKFKVDKSGTATSTTWYAGLGAASTPSYAFTSETNTGIYRLNTGIVTVSSQGTNVVNIGKNLAGNNVAIYPNSSASGVDIGDASLAGSGQYFRNFNSYSFFTAFASTTSTTAAIRLGCSADGVGILTTASGATQVLFAVEAANTFAFRNSTNAQSFYVYNTYTSGANFERGVFDWSTSANVLTIGAKTTGGTQRAVNFDAASYAFQVAGTAALNLTSSLLSPQTDGNIDLGAIGATRFNNGYFKSSVQITGASSGLTVNNLAYTNGTDFENGILSWSSNALSIGMSKGGSGGTRAVNFVQAGTTLMSFTTSATITTGTTFIPYTSTTSKAGFRLSAGTAPTSPVSGDMWFDGTNVLFRVGGTTKTFTLV
jgi:hypothetical protein